ncbi:MAG: hypothetical protein K6U74_09145, partial [Firmicutes bacterium]|nr:hypothetical protein [Bacillota bacterium]
MTGEGDKFIKKITEGAVKALTQAAFTEDGGIVLFFRPSGKEYFYEKGLDIWRPINFGTHLVSIFNAYISKDYTKLQRFTGEDDQKLAYERAGVLGRFAWG